MGEEDHAGFREQGPCRMHSQWHKSLTGCSSSYHPPLVSVWCVVGESIANCYRIPHTMVCSCARPSVARCWINRTEEETADAQPPPPGAVNRPSCRVWRHCPRYAAFTRPVCLASRPDSKLPKEHAEPGRCLSEYHSPSEKNTLIHIGGVVAQCHQGLQCGSGRIGTAGSKI